MDFNTKHPGVFNQPKAEYRDPYKSESMLVEPTIYFSGMYAGCNICDVTTAFRHDSGANDYWPTPICSEECLGALLANQAESTPTLPEISCLESSVPDGTTTTTMVADILNV